MIPEITWYFLYIANSTQSSHKTFLTSISSFPTSGILCFADTQEVFGHCAVWSHLDPDVLSLELWTDECLLCAIKVTGGLQDLLAPVSMLLIWMTKALLEGRDFQIHIDLFGGEGTKIKLISKSLL